MDIVLEARDASGAVITDHVEVVVATKATVAAMLVLGVAGVALAMWGFAGSGGWLIAVGVIGALLGLLGIGSFAASMAGRCVGMPWQFTP